ncbi:MAG: phosphoglycerate kinase [Alphaproteobacteria bacterium]|nr:phosphoglycerate kinase [Alphaproteobacteria bacterium]
MGRFRRLEDLDAVGLLKGGNVLVRIDLNVPLKDGRIADATRIERSLATLNELASRGAKSIVVAHFDRPKGKRVASMSLGPVAKALGEHLKRPVAFAEDCIGGAAEEAVAALGPGEVLVLENTRFHAGEEANDPDFAKALARHGDAFVSDAFSCAHRAHASTVGIARLLPSAAGRAMEAELDALSSVLDAPERPLAALVGGSKISTKLDLLRNLVAKVDVLVIGGGMANTFLAAQGIDVGRSMHEADLLPTAREILKRAQAVGCDIVLPKDVVLAREVKANAATRVAQADETGADEMILDVGAASLAAIEEKLSRCRTIVWNGPLGVFEVEPFGRGTFETARFVAERVADGELVAVAGGGDTAAALGAAGVADGFTYVSTAGGAFLEWLEGKALPGVEVLCEPR